MTSAIDPITFAVIKSALDIVSAQYPQAKQTDPNLIVDPSFVSRIEQSGFVAPLYKKYIRRPKKLEQEKRGV